MTCPDDDTLAAIASLPAGERAAIADHAASCETCRGLVKSLLGVAAVGSFAEAATLASGSLGSAPDMLSSIDRYRIDRRIGEGAMGVVYAGYDPELARPVAIKVLRGGGSPDRMKREAQALARLAHPNVVAVYDVGEREGRTFVAMALVDGDNLRTWLATPRTTSEIVDAIAQAARGLDAAHAAGIVHRDVKPDNIFVAKTGEVLVGDFGLARSFEEATPVADHSMLASNELTQTGALLGTPAYMAPEQVEGEATAASDLFALCVTAWEALFGQRPFTGRNIGELVAAVRTGTLRPPRRTRSVPRPVRAAIQRGLAAEPGDRHPSMAAFVAALARRPRWPYVAAAAIALAAMGGGALAMRGGGGGPSCDAIAPFSWTIPPGLEPPVVTMLQGVLGRYAADWQRLAQSSCEAAGRREVSQPAYTATQRCLEERRETFEWIFQQPADLARLAEALEPIETCSDLGGAPPTSPEHAALRRELGHAAVLVRQRPTITKGLDALVERARQSGDHTSIAEASYLIALAQYTRNLDPKEALSAAIAAAEPARNDRVRTRASALLAIATARTGRVSEAMMHRDRAVSAAMRANDPLTLEVVERANIEVASARRDVAGELAGYRRIEAILIARFGDLSTALIELRIDLANVLHRRKQPGAKGMSELAEAGLKHLGYEHPEFTLQQLATRETNPAVRLPTQVKIVELVRSTDPSRLFDELMALATDYELVGALERALDTLREALALDPASDLALVAAGRNALMLAERSETNAGRAAHLEEALGFVARISAQHRDREDVQTLRGRILVRAGRFGEALPDLTSALAAAERAEPQEPFQIALRSFALAEVLWETGGARERERALALAAHAARRFPEARPALAEFQEGALLHRLDEHLARVDAWRRTRR